MSTENKLCGCKGIRTCLLCEENLKHSSEPSEGKQADYIFTYCPHCNLCWPFDNGTASAFESPLYLGNIKVVLDFITEGEESAIVDEIDKIQWMPSQSGRRKQDFGPKVNFKKKKVKVGNFRGFPKFTEKILSKFKTIPQLSSFRAVELCHLEYTPERGSSIDPHVDDFWLWGERLVTVNLSSSTVLTLDRFSDGICECSQKLNFDVSLNKFSKKDLCPHNIHKVLSHKLCLNSSLTNEDSYQTERSSGLSMFDQNKLGNPISSTFDNLCNNSSKSVSNHAVQNSCSSKNSVKCSSFFNATYIVNEDVEFLNGSSTVVELLNSEQDSVEVENVSARIKSMCSIFRQGNSSPAVSVQVHLPPRSLLVIAGCARYNWCHSVKRQDVTSRRLAMTFRELTPEFLDDGEESMLGDKLLSIASNFCDFNE